MKFKATSNYSYIMEISKDDCQKNGVNFDMMKEYKLYQQNKHLYDKVPAYYFEPKSPSIPPKKTGFLKKIFRKKERPSENNEEITKVKTEMDLYFDKKFEELKAKGLPLYSKADLQRLYQNESKLVSLVIKYANAESQKEDSIFEDRGGFSYHYEITSNDTIVFDVDTLIRIM